MSLYELFIQKKFKKNADLVCKSTKDMIKREDSMLNLTTPKHYAVMSMNSVYYNDIFDYKLITINYCNQLTEPANRDFNLSITPRNQEEGTCTKWLRHVMLM